MGKTCLTSLPECNQTNLNVPIEGLVGRKLWQGEIGAHSLSGRVVQDGIQCD